MFDDVATEEGPLRWILPSEMAFSQLSPFLTLTASLLNTSRTSRARPAASPQANRENEGHSRLLLLPAALDGSLLANVSRPCARPQSAQLTSKAILSCRNIVGLLVIWTVRDKRDEYDPLNANIVCEYAAILAVGALHGRSAISPRRYTMLAACL